MTPSLLKSVQGWYPSFPCVWMGSSFQIHLSTHSSKQQVPCSYHHVKFEVKDAAKQKQICPRILFTESQHLGIYRVPKTMSHPP